MLPGIKNLNAATGACWLGLVCAAFCVAFVVPAGAQTVSLSEIRIDQPGADNDEYFELAGAAGTSLNGLTYLVIGDGTGGSGVIEAVVSLSGNSIPGSGFFVAAEGTFTLGTADLVASLNFENSDNVTHMVVDGFLGANGDDLDTNDDGVLDSTPWSQVVDCVAMLQAVGSGDLTYCATTVGPDGTFVPGHAYFCPGGWEIGAFDPVGGVDTPGSANACGPVQPTAFINEVRIDQPGTDNDEYFELIGPPGGSLDGLTYLVIGDGTGGSGVIEVVAALTGSTVPASGFFVAAEGTFTLGTADLTANLNFENGDNVTHLLVRDFTGANGDDLDVGDDGILDVTPWTEVVDCVALIATVGSGDLTYCATSVGPDGAFVPGHAYFCDSGWEIGAFDPVGGDDTPGAANACGGGPGGGGAVVINEIDYDQSGTDAAEFIELKNVDVAAVNLGGFEVQLINGSGGGSSTYNTIVLPAVALAPGDYFVICANAANTPQCDLDVSPDTNLVQNGAPDAVALFSGGILIDTVSYEGDTAAPYTEGSGSGLEDDAGIDFSGISRFPDGIDTDQNNVDFSPRCITPGAANLAANSGCTEPVLSPLVVNEVDYDQPGGDTAEFVELKNVTGSPLDLSVYTLQLVNGSGGAVYQSIALPAVSLAGGDYFVVCSNALTVANCDLAVISSIQNGAPDAVALTLGGMVVDTVSYEGDTVAPYTEGSGVGLEDSGATGEDFKGISRVPDGKDSDSNNTDFANVCITPGGPNTSFSTGCGPTGPVFEIWAIQGSGLASPFDGLVVTTVDNIVTAVGTSGFFIQTPEARTDGDPETSDGIFVFTGAAPTVAVGDQVDVSGEVDEFFNFTEFTGGVAVTVDSTGNPLPAVVVLDEITPSGDRPQPANEMERFEGMLVTFEGIATGPSDQFGDVAVVARDVRSYREPGIEYPGLVALPVWDGNPEIFEVNPDGLGAPDAAIFAGQEVAASGPLAFSFGDYQVWPTSLTLGPEPVLPRPVRDRANGEFTVASQNMLRFFDDQDDPATDDPVLTPAEFQATLDKFSLWIRGVLDAPDILAVEEVENLNALQALAAQIQADDPSLVYTASLLEGNDIGGIDVGFLTRDTVTINGVQQFGLSLLLSVDGSLLNDRPPLVLDATYTGGGASFDLTVIAVHHRSLSGIDNTGSSGTRVRIKRLEQAEHLADFIQDLQVMDPDRRIVVTGDFNGFQFTDGYADVLGIHTGNLDPAGAQFPSSDLVNPDLTNQVLSLDAEEQYSFVFGGSAQVLDHALTSVTLNPLVREFVYARGNADAPNALLANPTVPLRASDHDGLVLFLFADSDGDGVADGDDLCADTVIPESVPTQGLNPNHYALVDGDGIFDTPPGGVGDVFTIEDTAGCSCEQIITALGLGNGHRKHGCSVGVMRGWVSSAGN